MSTREKEITAAVAAAKIDMNRTSIMDAYNALAGCGDSFDEVGIRGVNHALQGALRVILGDEVFLRVLGEDPLVSEVLVAARAAGARLAPEMERLLGMLNDLTAVVGD